MHKIYSLFWKSFILVFASIYLVILLIYPVIIGIALYIEGKSFKEEVDLTFETISSYVQSDNDNKMDVIALMLNKIDGYLEIKDATTNEYYYFDPQKSLTDYVALPPSLDEKQAYTTEEKTFTETSSDGTKKTFVINVVAINAQKIAIMNNFESSVYAYLIIGIIFAFIVSYLLTTWFTKPVYKLLGRTKKIAALQLDGKNVLNRNDELGELDENLTIVEKNLEIAFSELNDNVEEAVALEKKRRLHMAMMSHELKTPLMILKGQTECMIDEIGKYKDKNKYLNENLKIIDQIDSLIRDMLLSAKIDDSEYKIAEEDVIVNEIVESTIESLEEFAFNNKKTIEYINEEIFEVKGDYKLLEMVMKNIIENAIKYNDEDFVEIYIDSNQVLVRNVYFKFPQNQHDINKLFSPFERIDKARNSDDGGHGIGLYLVKRILNLHNLNFTFTIIDGYVTFLIQK